MGWCDLSLSEALLISEAKYPHNQAKVSMSAAKAANVPCKTSLPSLGGKLSNIWSRDEGLHFVV